MARPRTIDVTATTPAPADTVFALLADGSTWPEWSSIASFELEQAGDPPPEGPGAIRVFRRGRVTGRDEIIERVTGRRLTYRSLSGVPVRDYVGQVDLAPNGQGTTIGWHVSFRPKVPGTGALVERGLQKFLTECAEGLAAYAATPSRSRLSELDRGHQ